MRHTDTSPTGGMSRRHPWHHHPGVRTGDELTLGERSADRMRNAMGSWAFVFGFVLVMIVWGVVNTIFIGKVLHGKPFDPYPYILLNLFLSMMAGLQGAILLIAAKRADQIASEQAVHHLQLSESTHQLLADNTTLTEAVKKDTALLEEIHRHVSALSPDAGDFEPGG